MTLEFTIIGATLPSLVLLRYFYKNDRYPEPSKVLMVTFGLGVLITVPVGLWAALIDQFGPQQASPMITAFYTAFFVAAIPEEFFKYAVISCYSAKNKAFDEPMDGVVYGATASLGFATLENILYVADGGWTVAIIRAFTAVPAHACWGAIIGYYVGQARFNTDRKSPLWLGLAAAVVLHGLYDFPLMTLSFAGQQGNNVDPGIAGSLPVAWLLILFGVVLIYGIVWTVRIVRRLRRDQLRLSQSS